jgi:stearoyl-CoA desaturase (delta-9 desaturase)
VEANSARLADSHAQEEPHNDIVYPAAIPFAIVHLLALGVFWTGFTATSVAMCVFLYFFRMWALTSAFHRYFSHRSYKTSRAFQFVLAFLAQLTAQRGVLWWSAIHRHHHLYSDTPKDIHSPRHTGFFFSHVGWIFSKQKGKADYSLVPDLMKFPELRWLDRHPYLPAFFLGVACFVIDGWPGLFVGFFLSTVILYHGTFAINSVAHVIGKQRYVTGDESKNNWWLALITLGEGWHNNHHHYQSSTRQGFFWWEIDISYYLLKVLSWTGLIWDLRAPPASVLAGEQKLGRRVVEQAAREIADSFPVEKLARDLHATSEHRPALEALRAALTRTRDSAASHIERTRGEIVAHLRELHFPGLPTVAELRSRLAERYADSPSLDEIAERAREILLEKLALHLGPDLQLGVT